MLLFAGFNYGMLFAIIQPGGLLRCIIMFTQTVNFHHLYIHCTLLEPARVLFIIHSQSDVRMLQKTETPCFGNAFLKNLQMWFVFGDEEMFSGPDFLNPVCICQKNEFRLAV